MGSSINPKVNVRANAGHLQTVSVNTKLQQQLISLPDGTAS